MKSPSFTLLSTLAALLGSFFLFPAHAAAPAGYRLVWADEFDGPTLDTNKWVHQQLGKRRDAINTKEAVAVKDGFLTITTYTEDGKQCTGFLSTHRKFEPVHGYWAARIQFDDSPGEWSAFWLMTPTMGRPIGDPGKAGTEIDICEHRVIDQKGVNLSNKVQHTLHWDGYQKDQHKRRPDEQGLRGRHRIPHVWPGVDDERISLLYRRAVGLGGHERHLPRRRVLSFNMRDS